MSEFNKLLLQHKTKKPVVFDYISAGELKAIDEDEELRDELIERTLGVTGITMIYGESNTGKTFLAIELSMCLATGRKFLGRNVNKTAVLYVASESPAGVMMRVRAWKQANQVDQADLFICPQQVNLYGSDYDKDIIIDTAKEINETYKVSIGLIIFDTLARVSSGANENSADMGLVMGRCDEIGMALATAVSVIHHAGKDSLKGARGWSGMRAHIDTEIEVSQSSLGSVAEITKQREIEGKGDRIGFRLQPIIVGRNQWGNPRATCVVVPCDAPSKTDGLKPNEREVLEFMKETNLGVNRAEICEGIGKDQSNTNKVIKSLLGKGAVYEQFGKLYMKQDLDDDKPF